MCHQIIEESGVNSASWRIPGGFDIVELGSKGWEVLSTEEKRGNRLRWKEKY